MKLFLAAIFVFGMSGTTLAQENELELHYHEIQYHAEGLHTYMKGTFDNIRYSLSDSLYSVNEKSLESALVGIRYVDEIVQIVDEYLEQLAGAQGCIDGVRGRWFTEKTIIGTNLSQCSQLAEDRIVGLYTPLYNAIEAGQRTSNLIQNLVVRTLAGWNPLEHEYDLDYLVEAEVAKFYLEFKDVTVPNLEQLLQAIVDQDEQLPLDVYTCSATAANVFRGVADEIQIDAWLC